MNKASYIRTNINIYRKKVNFLIETAIDVGTRPRKKN